MNRMLRRSLFAAVLPVVVFVAGAALMILASGHRAVERRLALLPVEEYRQPINLRLSGYDLATVQAQWTIFIKSSAATNSDAAELPKLQRSERLILYFDLFFPLLYGGSFLVSFFLLWDGLGRPFAPAWWIALVVVVMLADWTENVIQLQQLARLITGGPEALQAGWLQAASLGTRVKLHSFMACVLCVWFLAARLAWRNWPKR